MPDVARNGAKPPSSVVICGQPPETLWRDVGCRWAAFEYGDCSTSDRHRQIKTPRTIFSFGRWPEFLKFRLLSKTQFRHGCDSHSM